MRVVIAGGHGKIGLRLARLLGEREEHAISLIRSLAQEADVVALGAHPLVFDLESGSAQDLAKILDGADAVVFAAGAGPGSGVARKDTVDRGAAVLLAQACELAGVRRYVMVSSMGADAPPRRAPTRSSPPTWWPRRPPTTTCGPATWTGRSCARGR